MSYTLATQSFRFWSAIAICPHGAPCADCCWRWQGLHSRQGYGRTRYVLWIQQDRVEEVYVHRVAWVLTQGQGIPVGWSVCHRCDVRDCCNPAHLWLGTHQENRADGTTKGRRLRGAVQSHPVKLTEATVRALWAGHLAGQKQRQLAATYGISQVMVCQIVNGRAWAWVTGAGRTPPA